MTDDHVYTSELPFEEGGIPAAAVYCSDGRFGELFDDFLYGALDLPRYDRLAVPGGAACLAGHFAAYKEGDALAAQLEFLVHAHALPRVGAVDHGAHCSWGPSTGGGRRLTTVLQRAPRTPVTSF